MLVCLVGTVLYCFMLCIALRRSLPPHCKPYYELTIPPKCTKPITSHLFYSDVLLVVLLKYLTLL